MVFFIMKYLPKLSIKLEDYYVVPMWQMDTSGEFDFGLRIGHIIQTVMELLEQSSLYPVWLACIKLGR
jgi:hypothetical protein